MGHGSSGDPRTAPEQETVSERGRSVTVALIDDEPLVRGALGVALGGAGLELVGEADNTEEAIKLVLDLRPDVALMGIKLSGSPHLEAIEQLSRLAPASRILILTHSEENRVIEAIVAGASGYILKTAPLPTIITAVRATAAGECVISAQIAGKLLQRIRERDIPLTTAASDAGDAIRGVLTERELAIFSELASGKGNREIGAALGLSTNTVSNHIAKHPRQASPGKPRPSRRPGCPQRHLVTGSYVAHPARGRLQAQTLRSPQAWTCSRSWATHTAPGNASRQVDAEPVMFED